MWLLITYNFFCSTSTSRLSQLKIEMVQICIHAVGANVFNDYSFDWKTPASYREFPLCSVGGFTPLTSLVAAEKDEIFTIYNLFYRFVVEIYKK